MEGKVLMCGCINAGDDAFCPSAHRHVGRIAGYSGDRRSLAVHAGGQSINQDYI